MLGGEGLKTVWIEALPVLPGVEEYNRDALVTQVPNDLSGFLVSRDIPVHEVNVQVIQNLLRDPAGVARGG